MPKPKEVMSYRHDEAKAYIEKHQIHTLMENLLAKLLFSQPTNPIDFLREELKKLIALRGDTTGPAPTLYTPDNVRALFNQYDLNRSGVVSAQQYKDAYKTLAIPLRTTPAPHVNKAQFLDDVEASLKLKECTFY